MEFQDLMPEELMKLELSNSTKLEAIDELIELLAASGRITDKDKFRLAVLEREKLGTTGIGMGIAIPHGKSDTVKEASLCFGRSKNGITYDSYDNEPVHLLFLIAVPDGANDLHLQLLAQLSRRLMHKDFLEKLNNAESKQELLNIFNNKE